MELPRHFPPELSNQWVEDVRARWRVQKPSPIQFSAIKDFAYIEGLTALIELKTHEQQFGDPATSAIAYYSLCRWVPGWEKANRIINRKKSDPAYKRAINNDAGNFFRAVAEKVRSHIPIAGIPNPDSIESLYYQGAKTRLGTAVVILKAMEEEVALN